MKIFRNLVEKKKIEDMLKNVDVSMNVTSEYLHCIEEMLLKLELINISLDTDSHLTDKISHYKERFYFLQKKYEVSKSDDDISLVSIPSTSTAYNVELSMLLDDINGQIRGYFYLDTLDTFFHQEINSLNIEDYKIKLLELESKIQQSSVSDEELKNEISNRLVKTIWHLLKKEVELTENLDFYMKLSKNNQSSIQKKFLTKLIEKAEKDSYVRDYVRKNDIESLGFDYNMFSYMVKSKKKSKSLCGEQELVSPSTDLVASDNKQLVESRIFNLKISTPISKSIRLIKNVKRPEVIILEPKNRCLEYLETYISYWLKPSYIALHNYMPDFLIDWLLFLKDEKELPMKSIQQRLGKIFANIGVDSRETCILNYIDDCDPFIEDRNSPCLYDFYFNCHLVKENRDLKIILSICRYNHPNFIRVLDDCSEILRYKFYKMGNFQFIKFDSKYSDALLQEKIQRISSDLNPQIQKKIK